MKCQTTLDITQTVQTNKTLTRFLRACEGIHPGGLGANRYLARKDMLCRSPYETQASSFGSGPSKFSRARTPDTHTNKHTQYDIIWGSMSAQTTIPYTNITSIRMCVCVCVCNVRTLLTFGMNLHTIVITGALRLQRHWKSDAGDRINDPVDQIKTVSSKWKMEFGVVWW